MEKRYILFQKPFGVLSQFSGEGNTLAHFQLPTSVYPVGRLDKDSEGLLLLSNDGPFIQNFLINHPRTYWAQLDGQVTKQALSSLSSGIHLKTGLTRPCHCKMIQPEVPARIPPIRVRKNIPTSWIEMTLFEGKNRQVRKMTASVQFPTLRLIRVGLGKIFRPPLAAGKWIEVSKSELV